MSRQRWQILPPLSDEEVARRISELSDRPSRNTGHIEKAVNPLLVQLLHNRGIIDPSDYLPFLAADKSLSHDPMSLPDMERAVTRILRAMLGDELVAIYGDFDADGITATALMVQGLTRLGLKAVHYIPHRQDEGHGLNVDALKNLRDLGVSLIITVDCGIGGAAEIEQGRKMGLDVIVTDHHLAPEESPFCLAAVDPKRPDSAYPFPDLAGVGVAFKLLEAIYKATGKKCDLEEFLDLVALGTVTDMAPLTGENRYLVKRGIEVLNQSQRIGLRELIAMSGLEPGRLDAESISFALGPRLNASGRMAHAVTSYELLMTSSQEEARRLASELEFSNCERQRFTGEIFAAVRDRILTEGYDSPLLMVSGDDFPPGIIGVVAGKLADYFYRPAIVLHLDGDKARGSARSIPEFNISSALDECRELLSRFGGHRQAAGFILPKSNLDVLGARLIEIAGRELAGVDLRPSIHIDGIIALHELNGEIFRTTMSLAPFGQGNQLPTFLSRNVELLGSRRMGANGDHLRLKLRDRRLVWDAVAFDLGDRDLCSSSIDIVYTIGVDGWSGRELLRLNVLDFVPSL